MTACVFVDTSTMPLKTPKLNAPIANQMRDFVQGNNESASA